jgi:hypothetical protein
MKKEQYNELKAIVDSIENVDKELIDTKQLVLRINEIFGAPNYNGLFDNVDFDEMLRNNPFKKIQVPENLEIRYTGVDGMKFKVEDEPMHMNYTGTPNGYWGEATDSTSGELQSIYCTCNEVEEDTV